MTSITSTLPPELLSRTFSFLANRRDDVGACRLLREVAEHPYFSRYVTDLVWDASAYCGRLAVSWDEWRNQFAGDIGRRWSDPQGNERAVVEGARFTAIERFTQGVMGGEDSGLQDVFPAVDPDGADDWPIEATQGLDNLVIAQYMGCGKGFAEYQQLFRAERYIKTGGLTRPVLIKAFASMPKLRNVRFTDYRSLARDGESYDAC
ncbi:hypothetical protein LTR85_000676 [Meristemomyces frigidus]|nr:hypothetical protein LTR85_000676 [Meristemomyces frigidus]